MTQTDSHASSNLGVAIPCYNESDNIPLILERFKDVIDRDDVTVLLVDNGSTDDSPDILAEHVARYEFAKTYRVPENQGYGYGILEGLRQLENEHTYIGWTHADMQTDPADILKAYKIIRDKGCQENTYVKGLRHGRSLADNFFTCGMSVFETCLLQTGLWDINAQPNIFHRSFMRSWQDPPHDFSLDLYVLYQAKKQDLDLVRLDVVFPPRIHGESKWNTGLGAKWKFIKRTVSFSLELKKRLGGETVG